MKTFVNADLCNTSEKCINKKIYIRISKFVTKLTQSLALMLFISSSKKETPIILLSISELFSVFINFYNIHTFFDG